MVSMSHWGMFDARNIPYRLWPLLWANDVDTQFWSDLAGIDIQ
jgi:hypothetical protein